MVVSQASRPNVKQSQQDKLVSISFEALSLDFDICHAFQCMAGYESSIWTGVWLRAQLTIEQRLVTVRRVYFEAIPKYKDFLHQ
jgi:hypothetical protein